MWAHRLIAPGRLETVEVDEPGEPRAGRVVVRFEAGGICGSDLPSFLGVRDLLVGASHGKPGYPLHELVGEVEASAADDLPVGTRVVGWAEGHLGLAEKFVARADQVRALDDELPSVQATVIQPLCTVLYAVRRLGDVRGARVAVIGQGSIGMLFSYVLKAAGAGHVTGVDPIDRRDAADAFGVDTMEWSTSSEWAASLGDDARPDIVVEAVGHQAATLEHAVEAVAHGGTVLAFGVPDEHALRVPVRSLLPQGRDAAGRHHAGPAAVAGHRARLPRRAPRDARRLRHRRHPGRRRADGLRAGREADRGAAEGGAGGLMPPPITRASCRRGERN